MLVNKYKEYISSALWSSGLLYVFFILNFVGQVVLARLLVPEDFGKIVLALSIVEVLKIFFGFSVSMAYIREKESETLYGSAIYLAFLGWFGMIVFSIILFFPLSYFYGEDIAFFVCLITFFSLFTYISYVIEADMEKRLYFKKSSFIVGISSVIGMLFAIIFAYYDFKEKSLLIREIIAPIVLLLISVKYSTNKITFRYNKNEVKTMFHFVFKMLFSRGAEVVYFKVPLIILSSLFGSATLGLVSQMLYLAQLPSVALAPIATKISFVFYSHHSEDSENREQGRKLISKLLFLLSLPFSFLFFFYSEELLMLLWGDKWIDGAIYLRQLSIFTLLLPIWLNLKTYAYGLGKNIYVTRAYIFGSIVLVSSIFLISKQYLGLVYSISLVITLLCIIRKFKGYLYE